MSPLCLTWLIKESLGPCGESTSSDVVTNRNTLRIAARDLQTHWSVLGRDDGSTTDELIARVRWWLGSRWLVRPADRPRGQTCVRVRSPP